MKRNEMTTSLSFEVGEDACVNIDGHGCGKPKKRYYLYRRMCTVILYSSYDER